jgi:hypothetical protein
MGEPDAPGSGFREGRPDGSEEKVADKEILGSSSSWKTE